jgi:solute carrier family 35 protein E1
MLGYLLAALSMHGAAIRRLGLASPRLVGARMMPDDSTGIVADPQITPLRRRHFAEYANGGIRACRFQCSDDAGDKTEVYGLMNANEKVVLGPVAAWDRARVAFYFALWYVLSVIYSVKNKQAHIALALPNTIATAQLVVGAAVGAFIWSFRLRKAPTVSRASLLTLLPIGLFHGIGHLTGVFATAVGSVSFVQVVKSAGPVWACMLSGLVLRQAVSRRVWLSLIPIVGGVGLASAKELSFVWAAFLAAAASDLALALRNVYSKQSMDRPQAGNMTPENTFYLFTILSCLFCLPVTAALEWHGAAAAWRAAVGSAGATAASLLALIVQSGLYFTAYSEVQFRALDSVSPVTHAVGNTMRRVVIMVVTILFFRTPVTWLGAVGSTIAIAGSYLYAMAKTHEKQQADLAAAKRKAEGVVSAPAAAAGSAGRVEHPLLPLMRLIGKADGVWGC